MHMKKKSKFGWLNCIRNYRFNSIFLKNLKLIFCVLLLPFILILGISYYGYYWVQTGEEKSYVDERSTRIIMSIDNLFLGIRDQAMQVSYDSDVGLFLLAKSVTDDMFYDPQNIFHLTALYDNSVRVMESVYIYAPNSRAVISEAGRFGYDGFYDKVCIDGWKDNGKQYQVDYLSRTIMGGDRKETVSFYLTSKNISGVKGTVIFNMDINKLSEELDFGDDVELMIIDKEQILFDSRGIQNGEAIDDVQVLMQRSDKEIVIRDSLELDDLEVIIRIDSRQLYDKLAIIRNVMFSLVGGMLLITVLLAFYISQKIFDPISEILHALEEETSGMEERLLQNRNEISFIKETIYANLSKTKNIEEELVERINLLKKAQAVALQSQINPHFLNNTLETIKWMVIDQMGRGNQISKMLGCLSQLLRISLEDTDTFITLKEEMEYVKKYLFIQQTRLDQAFDVIWEVPEEMKECRVIRMILQPLVENAIKYGIKPYDNKGFLRIQAARMTEQEGGKEYVCIQVVDSGLGLTWEEADVINQSIRREVIKESDHIGLSNVHQRVILAFGEEYGVMIKSRIHEGTCVEVKLPYQVD